VGGIAQRIVVTLLLAGAPVHIGATRDDVLSAAAKVVLEAAQSQVGVAAPASNTRLSMVVSGGATTPALTRLVAESWQFSMLPTIILSDERWSASPALSNTRELAEHLEGSAFASCPMVNPTTSGDLQSSARDWATVVESYGNPFVSLISMGDDGHIASLFANHETEAVSDSVVICRTSPKPPSIRLSLSLNYLRKVPMRLAFALGESKASTLRRIKGGEPLPASEVAPTCWFIDEAAASGIRD
jgi:6-phosphogluconolactonase/glucosamine-6-phosphate isomerase/deaminase